MGERSGYEHLQCNACKKLIKVPIKEELSQYQFRCNKCKIEISQKKALAKTKAQNQ